MKRRNLLLCCLLAAGCRETTPTTEGAVTKAGSAEKTNAPAIKAPPPAEKVPLYRATVKAEPVAEYQEKTDNPLNDWYFSVKLYETPKTFPTAVLTGFAKPEFGLEIANVPAVSTSTKITTRAKSCI